MASCEQQLAALPRYTVHCPKGFLNLVWIKTLNIWSMFLLKLTWNQKKLWNLYCVTWLTINYHFCTVTKLNNSKSNHHKFGTVYIRKRHVIALFFTRERKSFSLILFCLSIKSWLLSLNKPNLSQRVIISINQCINATLQGKSARWRGARKIWRENINVHHRPLYISTANVM
jgi:hypothetical protein